MTYPKPGEVVLTDPQTGDVIRETFDHVDPEEHYVSCQTHTHVNGVRMAEESIKYPWRRVVAVRHEFQKDGTYATPDSEENDD